MVARLHETFPNYKIHYTHSSQHTNRKYHNFILQANNTVCFYPFGVYFFMGNTLT
jgi:hypothetical protein